MCGIVGFITAEKNIGAYNRKKWFVNALLADTIRGDDGTGIFLVRHEHEGNADWCKLGDDASHFLRTELAVKRLGYGVDFSPIRIAIGHNRSATVGNVSTANAHPFQEGPITLVHNGTLNGTYNLQKTKTDLKGADVDSHIITHNLAEHSPEEVIPRLNGAFVLVWHDARDQSVNIVRNDKRPFHIMLAGCEKTLLMASEAEMLAWLVRRNNDFKPGEIYYPEPGQWLKFTSENGIKPHVTKVDLYTHRTYSGGGYGYGSGWSDTDWEEWAGGYRGNPTQTSGTTEPPWYQQYKREKGLGESEAPRTTTADVSSALARKLQDKLPGVIRGTLKEVGLEPLDKLRFKVGSVHPIPGTKYGNVYGHLLDVNRMGVVQGLVYDAVKEAPRQQEIWTVLPVGVKAMDGTSVGMLLTRLLRRSAEWFTAPPPSSTSCSDDGTDCSEPDGMEDEGIEEIQFIDEGGNEITFDKWSELVKHGCCYCGSDIGLEDAIEMEWDRVTGQPVCPECVIEMFTNCVHDDETDNDEGAELCGSY